VASFASDHLAKKTAIAMEEETKEAADHINTNHSSEGRPKTGAAGTFMADDDSGDEVKDHESELSATSGIEMMDIDDFDSEYNDVT